MSFYLCEKQNGGNGKKELKASLGGGASSSPPRGSSPLRGSLLAEPARNYMRKCKSSKKCNNERNTHNNNFFIRQETFHITYLISVNLKIKIAEV
jgi:hypothetical protein